jgi:HEAT repeat protein
VSKHAEDIARDRHVEYLIKTLQDPEATARVQAAKLLGELKDSRGVDGLSAALFDGDAGVRRAAAQALEKIGPPASEALLTALNNPDQDVRHAAAKALGQTGEHRMIPSLIAALRDPQESVRSQAAFALNKMGARAVEPLIAALTSPDANTRLHAARILGSVGGDLRALSELQRLARDDSDNKVQEAAKLAAEKVRGR